MRTFIPGRLRLGIDTLTATALRASSLCCAMLALSATAHAVSFSEFVDPHPAAGNQFGAIVMPLSTGNVVITSPFDDFAAADAGAVYLFNGATGALISTLRGSTAGDNIGLHGVIALANGNFVISSHYWHNGAVANAGAVTWGSGTTGVSGSVSAANSLVGSKSGDTVGSSGATALSNGNYVVVSSTWDNGAVVNAGAATWGNGATGVSGAVTALNSLVGSAIGDNVGGSGVVALPSGNYVVISDSWDNGTAGNAGAVTWGSGTSGVSGAISAANSLVGPILGDNVGISGVWVLANGNYVVASPFWDNGGAADAGAATWCNGTSGRTGAVSAANSLVGSTAADYVAINAITPLTNGNYVVASPDWSNGSITTAGAVTWCDGASGRTGAVSTANSLVGSTVGDQAGGGGAWPLTNGNYVVVSPSWDNGVATDVGAATWASGASGLVGAVASANSLVGSTAFDEIGLGGVAMLPNGNCVVSSPVWQNGAAASVGATTWCSGTTGRTGTVSSANSLVGSSAGDQDASVVTALTNGSYIVANSYWDNGFNSDAGAVTWGSAASGVNGVISAANSLIGTAAGDIAGGDGVAALANGNYVVSSWNGLSGNGAVSWGSGTSGVSGVLSSANSLVGSSSGDLSFATVTPLPNGNYVVAAPYWSSGGLFAAGAATWGSGASGVSGVISVANSMIGGTNGDLVGLSGVTALSSGHYVVGSPNWSNLAIPAAGAATWGNGAVGTAGIVTAAMSLAGASSSTNLQAIVADNINGTFMAPFTAEVGGRVRVGAAASVVAAIDNTPPTASIDLALAGARPNPTRGNRMMVNFTLPSAEAARLELIDVSGRRVVSRDVGALGAGPHAVDLAQGKALAPGIYLVKLTQGARSRVVRAAVLR